MKAIIKVLGVGGAGCNAVNRMVEAGIEGVDFAALNTDIQALGVSAADFKVPIGSKLTKGQGAGGNPTVGEASAQESEKKIAELVEGADLVFIAAGMGGGTGTGAAPVVAKVAKSRGILTVAVVTRPFSFEGPQRKRIANQGVEDLRGVVDAIIVVPNDRLLPLAGKKLLVKEAFAMADDALQAGVQGISNIVLQAGEVNRDFADVSSVLRNSGTALMGLGRGIGERRAVDAVEMAVKSPLMEGSIQGIKRMLVNVSHGPDYTLFEHGDAMDYLQQFLDPVDGEIFIGLTEDPDLLGEVRVTVIAAGVSGESRPKETELFNAEPSRSARRPASEPVEEVKAVVTARTPEPLDLDEVTQNLPDFLRDRRK